MTGIRNETELEDFLGGTNFLSASGGGEPAVQRELLLDDMTRGLKLFWTPLDEMDPDALICTACFSGSIAPEVFDAAANLGIAMVDGDYAGRAIPELHATTPHLFGVEVLPWASVDEYGNSIVIRKAASNAFAERIGKHLALASFGLIGCALIALPVSEVRRIYVPGTISESFGVGRAIREARDSGGDPVAAAARSRDGRGPFPG